MWRDGLTSRLSLFVVPQKWGDLSDSVDVDVRYRWRHTLKNSKAGKAALETNKKVLAEAYYEMMAHRVAS